MCFHTTTRAALHLILSSLFSLFPVLCLAGTTTTAPSSTLAATGTVLFSAIPITSPNDTSLNNFSTQWSLSLALFTSSDELTTRLSLSWPPNTGPTPASLITVNVVYLYGLVPSNFTGLDPSAAGSGNCSALLGSACTDDVGKAALEWGDGPSPLRPSSFPNPGSCQSIHTSSDLSVNSGSFVPSLSVLTLTRFGDDESCLANMRICKVGFSVLLNPTNNTNLFNSYDPIDSSNASEVFNIARRRIWPVFVIEQVFSGLNLGNGTGNMVCPQALNLTGVGSVITSTSSSNGAAGGTGTSSSATTTGTGTANSGAGRVRSVEGVVVCGLVMLVILFIR